MKHIVVWRQALLVLCLSCSSFAFSQEEKEIRQNGISVNESNELIEQLKNRGRERRIFPIEVQYVWYDDACPHAESLGI